MSIIRDLENIVGNKNTLTGDDTKRYSCDWTGKYSFFPIAVVKPQSVKEVSEVAKACYRNNIPMVPIGGNTGLAGGTSAQNSVMISLERLNKIREIRSESQIAIVEAGVILSSLHDAAEEFNLVFPLTFGAKGSAMIGGVLSTNAGGSNVVRYGNTRTLCMGLEVVLPDGKIMNLMSELHKDNTGYDLKDLIIGAEGTLGLITAAVLKLKPKPIAYTTAMVAVPTLSKALELLNQLQKITGGCVEAFEYMTKSYIETHLQKISNARSPFDQLYDINIMLEIGTTIPDDVEIQSDGAIKITQKIEKTLSSLMESGDVLDAVIAQSISQRIEMWERREASAEITIIDGPMILTDIAVPLDKISSFMDKVEIEIEKINPGSKSLTVAHLGDGNLHYAIYPTKYDLELFDLLNCAVEEITQELGGSFSAEHGVGLSKKTSMKRRKDPIAIEVMRAIKKALDPKNLMNPGKVLPEI
jgi:FAD/FMN-containing dehydrogenase